MQKLISLVKSSGSRDTLMLLAGNLCEAFFAFLFTIISYRMMTTSDFGIFSALNNFIFTSVIVLDIGIGQALLHFLPIYRKEQDKYIGTALAIRLFLSGLICLLTLIFALPLSVKVFRSVTPVPVMIAGLAIVTVSFFDTIVFTLQGLKKFAVAVILSNSFSFLRFLGSLVFFLTAISYGYSKANAITFIASVIVFFIIIIFLRIPGNFRLNFDRLRMKEFLHFSGGLGVLKISQNAALRLDIQMVIILLGTVSAGVYSVAARLGNFYPIAIASLTSVFASRLSAHSDKASLKRISKKALMAVAVVVAGILFCSLFSYQIISLLFGSNTYQAGHIYRYLSLSYIPLVLASLPLSLIIYWFKKPGIAGKLGLIQLVLIISGHFLLIPQFHEMGPVISLSIANTSLLLTSLVVVKKLWTSA